MARVGARTKEGSTWRASPGGGARAEGRDGAGPAVNGRGSGGRGRGLCCGGGVAPQPGRRRSLGGEFWSWAGGLTGGGRRESDGAGEGAGARQPGQPKPLSNEFTVTQLVVASLAASWQACFLLSVYPFDGVISKVPDANSEKMLILKMIPLTQVCVWVNRRERLQLLQNCVPVCSGTVGAFM